MAEQGKPLVEAKVKLSVEGAPQVRAELKGVTGEAQATAGAMGQVDTATTKADATVKSATKSVRELTGGFTRLIGSATAVLGAIYAVGRAVEGVTTYIDFLTNSTKALADIQAKTGGLVPGTGREAQAQLDAIRERLEGVNAELGRTLEGPTGIVGLAQAVGGPVAGLATSIDALVNGTGRLASTIEAEKASLEGQAVALERRLSKERELEATRKRLAAIEKEEVASLTDEERQVRRLNDLDKLKEGASEAETARINAIKARIEAEIRAQREADAEKRKADRKASDDRIREIVNESKAAIEADRKRQKEQEERSIEGQRRVFSAGRDLAAQNLQSIAVTNAQSLGLLRMIAANGANQVWPS